MSGIDELVFWVVIISVLLVSFRLLVWDRFKKK